jgi:hypothetical protein
MNEKSPGKRKLKWCFITLLVLVVVPYGQRTYLRSRMSPDQIALIGVIQPCSTPSGWTPRPRLLYQAQSATMRLASASICSSARPTVGESSSP